MPDFARPPLSALETQLKPLLAWRFLTSPRFFGLEHVPRAGPALFVGNHTLYGVFDPPLLWLELYREKDVYLRFLGDHIHFKLPFWGSFLERYGVVDGTRENCSRLLDAGEAVAVFPGGGREVAKRHGERYKLIWKERLGFAKMAIKHRCPLVPFASIGAEEALDILVDADQLLASPLGPAIRALDLRADVLLPICRGLGPTPLPRPERFYFAFAPAIDTRRWAGREDDIEACRELRDEARAAVEGKIAELLAVRDEDPLRGLAARLKSLARRRWTGDGA